MNAQPMLSRLLVATKNAHKTAEIQAILGTQWEVTDLTSYPQIPSPEETGLTFEENAVIKALATCAWYDGLVFSDDSGLEVDVLDGAPGVRSARFAGPSATDAENRKKLLAEIARTGTQIGAAKARFRCAIALVNDSKVVGTFDGSVEGVILEDERGGNGFGYDSLFVPDGYRQTFAELSNEVKNGISHRARALGKALPHLLNLASDGGYRC